MVEVMLGKGKMGSKLSTQNSHSIETVKVDLETKTNRFVNNGSTQSDNLKNRLRLTIPCKTIKFRERRETVCKQMCMCVCVLFFLLLLIINKLSAEVVRKLLGERVSCTSIKSN